MNLRQFITSRAWWGKLLGAFFGYLIMGSIGALFGLLIGNFFDRGLVSHFSNIRWLFYSEKRTGVQKIFYEINFLVMGFIAKADGRVSELEIKMARTIMAEMRLNRAQKNRAKILFNEGKNLQNIEPVLIKLHTQCYDNPALLKLFIDIQYRAAQVDGLSAEKIKVLDSILNCLGFAPFQNQQQFYEGFSNSGNQSTHSNQSTSTDQTYSGYHRYNAGPKSSYAYNSNLDLAYNLLEVSSTATKQEVKRAYRRQLSQNHPDKLIAQKKSEAMIKIANEKTQRIVKAYEIICASKGW